MYPNMSETLITKGLNAIKGLGFSGILEGTEKTLGVINQAIPIVYQIKPLISNVKTIFKISNLINDNSTEDRSITNNNSDTTKNSPIFYCFFKQIALE